MACSVALLTRGVGAYAYDYMSPVTPVRGDLCVVSFRDRLEIGVVLGPSDEHAAHGKLLELCPVSVEDDSAWGAMLCDLAELCAATPREVAGYLLFAPPAQGLKLQLSLAGPEHLPAALRSTVADLCGMLTPARRRRLMSLAPWAQLAQHCARGTLGFELHLAGRPGVTRPHSKLRKKYVVDHATANLLGLAEQPAGPLPGNYLAGLIDDLDFGLEPAPAGSQPVVESTNRTLANSTGLSWHDLAWPEEWALCRRWPELLDTPLRRTQARWEKLRAPTGLVAELAADINAGCNTLVIAPQPWMLDRIWPALAPWATRVHRYRNDAGTTGAAAVLTALSDPGQVVCGLESAWKLAVYGRFDRVILLDPGHPGFEPGGDPWLDPRTALLTAVARRGIRLDLIELGLSPWDGATQLRQAALLAPREPDDSPAAAEGHVDLDPLPLQLRQPDRRRLVYFNRLGQGRGLRCAECGTAAHCPQCHSRWIYFSGRRGAYICPDCHWESADLRCRNCGTATLAAELSGLEALTRRPGDILVSGPRGRPSSHPEHGSVIGTAQLLEPLAEFWPQEIVYVHAEGSPGLIDDWPRAVDMASRLCALYANPHLQYAYIVSARLRQKLGTSITSAQITDAFTQEFGLRRLAGLPPFGRILRLRWRGNDARQVQAAGQAVIESLRHDAPDVMLGLGRPHRRRDGFHLAGYVVNPEISHDELQQLRFRHRKVAMSIRVIWGPWT